MDHFSSSFFSFITRLMLHTSESLMEASVQAKQVTRWILWDSIQGTLLLKTNSWILVSSTMSFMRSAHLYLVMGTKYLELTFLFYASADALPFNVWYDGWVCLGYVTVCASPRDAILILTIYHLYQDPDNFPPFIGANHASPFVRGPLKSDWTKACPEDWSQTERDEKCECPISKLVYVILRTKKAIIFHLTPHVTLLHAQASASLNVFTGQSCSSVLSPSRKRSTHTISSIAHTVLATPRPRGREWILPLVFPTWRSKAWRNEAGASFVLFHCVWEGGETGDWNENVPKGEEVEH